MVKVVRVPADDMDIDSIKAEIIRFNEWIQPESLEIVRKFEINILGMSYTNCILACDVEVQEQLVQRGAILYGMNTCRVYEQMDILQCKKCSRFGHIAINCSNVTCRKCSGPHKHADCDSVELKCVNCEMANKSFNKDLGTNHNAALDRCPMRMERINAIKRLIMAKNE